MSWSSKVIWSEGMFLQPQHLQQHERHLERLIEGRTGATTICPWGFSKLEADDAAAGLGKVALLSARGVFPDGTPFDFPSQDAAPLPFDVPASAKEERIVLAVPLARPGSLEADIERRDPTGLTRYVTSEVEVTDSTLASAHPALVQVGELRLSLMLARDATDAYATLPVARLKERQVNGQLDFDRAFIPPVLATRAVNVLSGFLAELVGKLHRKGDELGQRLEHPGRGGVAEIAEFLMLQTINRYEPVFRHLSELPTLHPSEMYAHCLMLAGDLSTFSRAGRRPREYPPYIHDDLQLCFGPLMDDLWDSLSQEHARNAVPIELLERKFGLRVARITDLELLRSASFVLAVNAQMPGETLRTQFPRQVRIGPVERIRDLVNLALPGIVLQPQPVAPRQLPFHAGFSYFALEQTGELWTQLQQSGGLAMHIAGDFPGLELEFWAIRG